MEIFGYSFKDGTLAEQALTTPSYRMDHPDVTDNQRLEFLGDAVLGLLAAERLVVAFPKEHEGSLTVQRTHMVSSPALCAAARRHGLQTRLRRNRGAAELSANSKILADAVESVIGAAYLDGGFAAARQVFEALELTENASTGAWSANPKGELQIFTQAMMPPRRPEYRLLKVEGKAHEPVFTVSVSVEGIGEATASAHVRKEAESEAAAKLLELTHKSQV